MFTDKNEFSKRLFDFRDGICKIKRMYELQQTTFVEIELDNSPFEKTPGLRCIVRVYDIEDEAWLFNINLKAFMMKNNRFVMTGFLAQESDITGWNRRTLHSTRMELRNKSISGEYKIDYARKEKNAYAINLFI